MSTAKVTSNGRVTIPQDVRNTLGIVAGDKLEFVRMEDGHFAVIPASIPLMSLKGIIPKPDRPVSIKEMNDAIAESASKK